MPKDLVVQDEFAILNPAKDIKEILELNLGGEALTARDLERITVPAAGGTVWSVPSLDGETDMREINAIIIHSQVQRTYWKDAFSGGGLPPDCWSPDAITGYGDPGGECKDCPMAQFGSRKNGRGQACQTKRVMFLAMPESILPISLNIPPGSLANARSYLMGLASKGLEVYSVITQLSLTTDKNKDGIKYSKVVFKRVGNVPDLEAVRDYVSTIKGSLEKAASDLAKNRDNDPAPQAE